MNKSMLMVVLNSNSNITLTSSSILSTTVHIPLIQSTSYCINISNVTISATISPKCSPNLKNNLRNGIVYFNLVCESQMDTTFAAIVSGSVVGVIVVVVVVIVVLVPKVRRTIFLLQSDKGLLFITNLDLKCKVTTPDFGKRNILS